MLQYRYFIVWWNLLEIMVWKLKPKMDVFLYHWRLASGTSQTMMSKWLSKQECWSLYLTCKFCNFEPKLELHKCVIQSIFHCFLSICFIEKICPRSCFEVIAWLVQGTNYLRTKSSLSVNIKWQGKTMVTKCKHNLLEHTFSISTLTAMANLMTSSNARSVITVTCAKR